MKFFGSLRAFGASLLFAAGALFLSLSLSSPAFPAPAGRVTSVIFAEMDGVIGVPLEEYVENVFNSVRGRDNLLIFRMDTPGGLVTSMSRIMTLIAEADYPVAVWVAPSGAGASSAGAFIAQAAHIAAMAPGTNIGAAHPVAGGKDIGSTDIKRKITNDLASKIRSFAQERGRNVKAAESMVRESLSLTSQEALAKGVIDFIAADEKELLKKLDGRKVKIKGTERTLSLKNSVITRLEVPMRLRILTALSRPDFAYLALLAGVFLIIIELRSPGGFAAGVSGGILLLLASYGLRVLPVNYVGVTLLLGGILVIIADLFIGGIGIISAAGVAAMGFGGLILFRAPGGELLNISPLFVITTSLVIGAVFLLVTRLVYKALRSKPYSGSEGMTGERGVVARNERGKTMAMVAGEYWSVIPTDAATPLSPGDEVEVVRAEVLTLYVKLIKKAAEAEAPEREGGEL